MRIRSLVLVTLTILVLVLSFTPVSLSYVTTDSMEPTIEPNDMYLLVPATNLQPGDIITFQSKAYGGPVTHRIIGETTDGYITQGDANDVADQAGDVPPVTRDKIIGEVFTVRGHPVTVDNGAMVVTVLSENRALFIAVLIALLLLDILLSTGGGTFIRDTSRQLSYLDLYQTVITVAIVLLTILLWVSISTSTILIFATNSPTPDAPTHVELGQQETVTTAYGANDVPGFYRIIEADGATVTDTRMMDARTLEVALEVGPYMDAGRHAVTVQYATYPQTLPLQVIRVLHAIHPLLAAFATASAPMLVLYVIGRTFLNGRVPARDPNSRTVRRLFD